LVHYGPAVILPWLDVDIAAWDSLPKIPFGPCRPELLEAIEYEGIAL